MQVACSMESYSYILKGLTMLYNMTCEKHKYSKDGKANYL